MKRPKTPLNQYEDISSGEFCDDMIDFIITKRTSFFRINKKMQGSYLIAYFITIWIYLEENHNRVTLCYNEMT